MNSKTFIIKVGIPMYQCSECGKIFTVPITYYGECLEHFGYPCREKWTGSPCCFAAYDTIQKDKMSTGKLCKQNHP